LPTALTNTANATYRFAIHWSAIVLILIKLGFKGQSAFPSPLCHPINPEKSGAFSLPVSVSPVADLRLS